MSFSENLKKSRQRAGLTQQQIANALGITKSTYCGYETGKRQPDIPKLRRLSLLLCTSADELLGLAGGDPEYTVSSSEFDLVKVYRTLDAHGQRLVRVILEEESTRMHAEMRAQAFSASPDNTSMLCMAKGAVACEPGVYLGPDAFSLIQVRREALSPGIAFAVEVKGTSLMPRFRDHDILLIAESKPQIGDVGLFVRNGLGFVRIMGYSELLSINPAYLPLPFTPDIHPCGTVVGVLSPSDLL